MIGDAAEVETEAAAVESEGIDAGATIDAGELGGVAAGGEGTREGGEVGGVEHKAIIATAAVEHIGSAAPGDGVVAGIAHDGFAGNASGEGVVAGAAELIHEGLGEGAGGRSEDHITATRI